jgi:hypothetical protein
MTYNHVYFSHTTREQHVGGVLFFLRNEPCTIAEIRCPGKNLFANCSSERRGEYVLLRGASPTSRFKERSSPSRPRP